MNKEIDFTKTISEEIEEKNKTDLLNNPESQKEKIFFYLYDNGEQTAEKLCKIAKIENPNSFYVLRTRHKEDLIISRKEGTKTFYDLSPTYKEQLEIKIKNKNKEIEFQKEQNKILEVCSNKKEELLKEMKSFFETNKKELKICQKNKILYLDFEKLTEDSPSISEELIENPKETLELFEYSIEEMGLATNIKIKIENLSKIYERKIENLRSNDINKFRSVVGRVMQLSDVKSQCVNAKFECPSCGTIISVSQTEKKFKEPKRCSCGRRSGFKLINKEMINMARIILEDLYEKSDSPLSKRINCFIKEDLVNEKNIKKVFPGNEIKIYGTIKEIPVELNKGGISTIFEKIIEINNLEPSEDEINLNNFSEEEIIQIKELASKIDINGLKELRESFAPDISGLEQEKNAIILFLANKKNEKKNNKTRNKSNICFVGDPGTGKTVLCNRAVQLTPGSRKQTGGSASAVGLTASVIKDDFTGGWGVQPGACVLAKEFLFIDELNNLGEEEKPKLQEAMSEQEINIAKASIQAKLPVTGGFLACANPKEGIFKKNIPLTKQFNIQSAILNRYDLVFVIKDVVNTEKDKAISKAMIERHRNILNQTYNDEFLKKFFFYVRNFEEPKITGEIQKKLINVFVSARKFKDNDRYINARLQESLIRLAISSAKLRLSEKIEEKDIERAIEVLSASYYMLPSYKILKNKEKQE